jgi:predicted ester cyclase
MVPDRRFHSVEAQFSDGRSVVTRIVWEPTPVADVPGFATRGEAIRLDLACIGTVRDGRIADYHDYG